MKKTFFVSMFIAMAAMFAFSDVDGYGNLAWGASFDVSVDILRTESRKIGENTLRTTMTIYGEQRTVDFIFINDRFASVEYLLRGNEFAMVKIILDEIYGASTFYSGYWTWIIGGEYNVNIMIYMQRDGSFLYTMNSNAIVRGTK